MVGHGEAMSVFKNGTNYHYEIVLNGRRYRGSTGTANKALTIQEEHRQRLRLDKSYIQVLEEEARERQRMNVPQAEDEFLAEYRTRHESPKYAEYALKHVKDAVGAKLIVEITPAVVKRYQTTRLAEKAGPKTINDELMLLLRLCGEQGDLIRSALKREKSLKLKMPPSPGRAFTADEKSRMLAEAAKLRSKNILPALALDLNSGLRDKELRELRWQQVDLVHKILTVGKSKTDAGTGRVVPLNEIALAALQKHAAWYTRRFGECRPEWYVFPAGKGQHNDPTRPVTTLKTAWIKVRKKAGVVGR
jgi:integrase